MQSYKTKTTYNHTSSGPGPSYTAKSRYEQTDQHQPKGPVRKTLTSDSTQNLWCRDTYWQYIVDSLGFNPFKETNGCHLRSCNHNAEDCRGAHTLESVKPLPHIVKFNKLDKAKFDWVKLYNCVKQTLTQDIPKVHSKEHLEYLGKLSSMNFIELIQLWRNMACYYNKLAKELPERKHVEGSINKHSSGFTFNDEVPKFRVSDGLEDTAWAFERLTRWCPTQIKFNKDIRENKKVTVWDLCLATGINCKEGIHTISEMICIDNFLTGKCTCLSVQDLEVKECQLQQELIELSTKLVEIVDKESKPVKASSSDDIDDEGLAEFAEMSEWTKPKSKRNDKKKQIDPKIQIRSEITRVEKQIEQLVNSRSIHYTELGMVPFNEQYTQFQERVSAELAEKAAAASSAPAESKESWDHGLIENAKIDKPVVKVSKLGNKKK